MKQELKNKRGITLIALVITIIVLLILAGISIAMLTGDNGLLTKASQAKTLTQKANLEEQIKMAVMASMITENGIGEVDETILEDELAKAGITADMIEKSPADANGSTMPWIISNGTSAFEVDKEGNVTAKGAVIQISGLTVKNGDTVLTDENKSIPEGTPLTISFTATITDGTITSISPSVPYTPEAGNVKTSETFVIKGKSADGTPVERTYVVNLKGYYNIPELQVGDYVNYTPSSVAPETVTELNTEINANSGKNDYTGISDLTTTLEQESLQWRVLEIDSEGNPTKLISAQPTTNTLSLYGANGYNNAVYLLNKACKTLYSGEYGDAQSITIEDIEGKDCEHYSDAGKNVRNTYKNAVTYGETIKYTSSSRYPKIAEEENGMGINTTPLDENNKNPIKRDGLDLSKQDKIYTGKTDTNAANGITVTQTYYYLNSSSTGLSNNLANAYTDNVYYQLFHGSINNWYWLASRCVGTGSTYCDFHVRYAGSSFLGAGYLFGSSGGTNDYTARLRPVVSLKSGVKADYASKGSTYNTWNLSM